MPLSTLFQLYISIMAVSFICGGNQSTRRKPSKLQTAASHWQTWSHDVVSITRSSNGI